MKKKRVTTIMMIAAMSFSILNLQSFENIDTAYAATVEEANQGSVFLKQEKGDTCTLCSATMLLRRVSMMRGDSDWSSITESDVRTVAWFSSGLYYNFTYRGMSITNTSVNRGNTNVLINMLKEHPEGIVVYNTSQPHAVLLTDYTDGVFYCADPANGLPYGRIPMSKASIGIDTISSVWYYNGPPVHFIDPTPSKPDLKVTANTASDKVTFSWNACSNTDRYDLRVYSEGMTGDNYFIYQQTTDTSLTYTLPEGKWWANVVAVNNTATDHETYGWSEENHFSVNFGYPEPKAMTTYNGHIYALYEATTYYDQAQDICKKMGGHLATITSADENKAVASLMGKASDIGYWMGASDAMSEGTWVWETGEKFSYTNWDKNEPNNDSEVEHYLTILLTIPTTFGIREMQLSTTTM